MMVKLAALFAAAAVTSGVADETGFVLTPAAEAGFQKVIASYKKEGLGSEGATLEGIAIDGHQVTLSVRVDGNPLSWRLESPAAAEGEAAQTWFTWTLASGDDTTAAAVEARKRLSGWLQASFSASPWVHRHLAPAKESPDAGGVPRGSRPLPTWVVAGLAGVTALFGVGLVWRKRKK